MNKKTFYIHTAETEYLCTNCGKHHLSIASEKPNRSQEEFNDVENNPNLSEEMRQFALERWKRGPLVFICQNCKAEFFYEVDLIMNEDAYQATNPEATEKEIQTYLEDTKDEEVKPNPEYQLDISINIDTDQYELIEKDREDLN